MPTPKPKKVGRPTLPKGNAKDVMLRVRVTGDDLKAMKANVAANVSKLREHLDLVERQFSDGRDFLLGGAIDLMDISLYPAVDFLRGCRNGNERIPDDYPFVKGWMSRVAAIGHGVRHEIERADALAIAARSAPVPALPSTGNQGPWPGEKVRFAPWAPSGQIIEGKLISARPRRVSIRRLTQALGETVVHLPRNAGSLACT